MIELDFVLDNFDRNFFRVMGVVRLDDDAERTLSELLLNNVSAVYFLSDLNNVVPVLIVVSVVE